MVFPLIAGASSRDYVAGTPEVISFRYIDGTCLRKELLATRCVIKDKVMARGTLANPAALVDAQYSPVMKRFTTG
jgi:hypothetical protein